MSTQKDLCRLLFQTASEGLLILKKNRIVDCNDTAPKMFADSHAALIGKTLLQLSPPSQPEGIKSAQAFQEKMDVVYSGQPQYFEWQFQRPGGETFLTLVALNAAQFEQETYIRVSIRPLEPTVHKSEEKFRDIVEVSPVGIFHTTPEGQCTYVNEQWRAIAGMSFEEALGDGWSQAIHPDDQARVFAEWTQAVESDEMFQSEYRFLRSDGVVTWVLGQSVAQRNAQNHIIGYVGTLTDIDERRRIEEALKASEAKSRALLEAIPDLMFRFNRKGIFIDYKATSDDLVTPPSLFLGKKVTDLFPAELAQKTLQYIDLALETGEMQLFEYRLQTSNGRLGDFEARLVATEDNEVLMLARDITDRKQAEVDLSTQRSFLRQIIDANPHFIFAKDQEGQFVLVNQALADFFGTVPEEIVGKRDADFNPNEEEVQAVLEDDREVMDSLESKFVPEERFTGAEGKAVWLQTVKVPLIDEDGVSRQVLGVSTDITDRKRLEEQIRESLERRGRQVQVATLVAQEVVGASDLASLYQRVVIQVQEQFGFYHTQLFRYEAEENVLKLAAGYGDVGQSMKKKGYQRSLGEGTVGQAAMLGTPILRSHLADNPDWQPNPQLPEAKGELAIPIKLGQSEAQAQAMALKAFIDNKFDGFIVCVMDSEMMTPIAQEALSHGLHVVTQTEDLDIKARSSFVGIKEHQAGYLLGQQAGRWARLHLKTGEKLKLARFNYRALDQIVQREEGITAGLRSILGQNFEIVGNEVAVDSMTARPIVERWLKTYPDLRMVLGINDGTALGAYQALVAAGKDDPDQFFIGGVDATHEALAAIESGGAFQATVDNPPREIGIVAVQTLVAAIIGQPYEASTLIPTRLVHRNNLAEFLASRQRNRLDEREDRFSTSDLRGIKVGLSVMDLLNPFYTEMSKGAREEAERLGIELVVNDPKPVLGVLHVQSDARHQLDAEDQLALEGLSGQIAVAIENTRLLEEANIFRQFAEAAGQGFGMSTLEGEMVYVNPSLARIIGKDSQDIVGQSLLSYYPEEQQHLILEEAIPMVIQKGQWSDELTIISSEGQVTPVLENYFLIRDENEQPIYIADVVTNITTQKKTEAELESRLHELDALHRLMNKEAWQAYTAAQEETMQGYWFDRTTVHSLTPEDFEDSQIRNLLPSKVETQAAVTKPVAVHGEIIGQIGVYDETDQPLTTEEREFLDAIAEQVAEALERVRLLEQTQKRAAELESVAHLSTVASTTLEVDKLLQTVVDLTKESFNLYHAHIYLLDKAGEILNLVAGAGEVGRTMVQQGWRIPLAREDSLVARTARTRKGVIVNDVQAEPGFLPNPLLPETRSELAVPLIVGERVLGVLDVQSERVDRFTEEDISVKTTLGAQIAVALQNANLYTQMQDALTEAETLYDVSAELNAANSLQEALQAAVNPGSAEGAINAGLFNLELDESGEPLSAELIATWTAQGDSPVSIGTQFFLPEFPFSRLWIEEPNTPILVNNIAQDDRMDEVTQMVFQASEIQAFVLMPLFLAGRWIGLISINWREPYQFSATEYRLYRALTSQTSVVVNNLLLFDETQQRAAQLATLNEVEVALSQAVTEDALLAAVAHILIDEEGVRISLSYFDVDEEGNPETVTTVAGRRDGTILIDDPTLDRSLNLDKYPFAQFLTGGEAVESVIFIENINTDDRIDDKSRLWLEQAGIQTMALLPLHSGGRWQGVITFGWTKTHQFEAGEKFLFQQLLEPIAAIVASRQAYVALEMDRQRAETVVQISTAMYRAEDEQQMLAPVAKLAGQYNVALTSLGYFHTDEKGNPFMVEIVALCSGEGQSLPLSSLPTTTFNNESFPIIELLYQTPDTPLFVENVFTDPRCDKNLQQYLNRIDTAAFVALPFKTGKRWQGLITLHWPNPQSFDHDMEALFTHLRPRLADVVTSRRAQLAQQVARRESELLYQISRNLNLAQNEEELLQAVLPPVKEFGIFRANLMYIYSNEIGDPHSVEIVASWHHEGQQEMVDQRFALTDFATARLWMNKPNEPVFITDVSDERLDRDSRGLFGLYHIGAEVIIPLAQGGRWVGLLVFDWAEAHEFGERERELYQALIGLTAPAVANRRAQSAQQESFAEMQTLYDASFRFNLAETKEDVLDVIVRTVQQSQISNAGIWLFDLDENNEPKYAQLVSVWTKGRYSFGYEVAKRYPISELPADQIWLEHPDETLLIGNVAVDKRLRGKSEILEDLVELEIAALAYLPMRIGERWLGLVSIHWAEPYTFTSNEERIYRTLMVQSTVAINNRLLFEQTEIALSETESLYQANRRINEAEDLQEMIEALVETGTVSVFNRAILNLLEYNDVSNKPESFIVAATWHSGQGNPPTPINTYYSVVEFPYLRKYLTQEPLFIGDVQRDSSLKAEELAFMKRENTHAMAALPLWGTERQLGVLLLQAEERYEFTEREMKPYIALSQQLARALENQRLLEETRLALEQVEAVQRRYTVQAWETYRSKNVIQDYERVREGMSGLKEDAAEIDQAMANKKATVITTSSPGSQLPESVSDNGDQEQSGDNSQKPHSSLLVPLTIRDQIIGILGLQDDKREWTPQEVALVEAVSQQLVQAAENLRFLDESQQRAAREAQINEISEKIQSAQTLEEALQVAVREIGLSLRTPQTTVQLDVE